MSGYYWRHDETSHKRASRLLRTILRQVARTGFLLRPAGLNNRAAALLARLKRRWFWSRAPVIRVRPGTQLACHGRIPQTHIIEVDE